MKCYRSSHLQTIMTNTLHFKLYLKKFYKVQAKELVKNKNGSIELILYNSCIDMFKRLVLEIVDCFITT